MLTVTETAARAVHELVSQPDLPDEAGLRIAVTKMRQNGAGPVPELELTVVSSPEPEDRELEELSIYLEPDTADYLDDMVLDAEFEGDQVRFSLHGQETAD